MAKSAKLRVGNLGEPCTEIREFWLHEGSVSLNPLRRKEYKKIQKINIS
jgi:hypothetical protein